MPSRSVAVAVTLTVLCAAGAIGAFIEASRYRGEGKALLSRGHAEAQEYAATFEGAYADKQERSLDARRIILERSHHWQRIQMVLVLCTVVGAFVSYLLYLLSRLRSQLLQGGQDALSDDERDLSRAR